MKSGIQKWLRQLGYEDIHQKGGYLDLSISSLAKKKTNASAPKTDSLEKRIKELERLLEDEQLRSEAYSRITRFGAFKEPHNREIMEELLSKKSYNCKPITGQRTACKCITGLS
jgi:hypothetical protein